MLVNTIVQSRRNEKCDDIDVHLLNTAPRLLSRIGGRFYFLFLLYASAVMSVRQNCLPNTASPLIPGIFRVRLWNLVAQWVYKFEQMSK